MRAYGYRSNGGPEEQEFLELDEPTPLPAELLVRVRAAGVNPFDWKVRQGLFGAKDAAELPAVLGSEVAGVVRAVGSDVEGFAVGDEVFGAVAPGSGGYAETTLLSAGTAAAKPAQVSFTDAAAFTIAGGTAYGLLARLGLAAGQSVLINGVSGGVGVAAAQFARDAGVNVIGVAGEDKRGYVEALGATLVPYGPGIADRVRQLLPDGVDGIIDLAGGEGLHAVAELVTDRSRLLSAADPTVAELGGQWFESASSAETLTAVAALARDGKFDPLVEQTYPFDEAAEALAAVEVGHARGKVVITFE